MLRSIKDLHTDIIISRCCTSEEAAVILGGLVGYTKWAVYKWMERGIKDPMLAWVNFKYVEWRQQLDD